LSAPRASGPGGSRWSAAQLVIPWTLSFVLLCVAVAGWWPRLLEPETVAVASTTSQWRAALGRDRMLADVPRVGHWTWEGDGAHGTGDVVWDNERQRGFLRLQGLAPNDPHAGRYQLWIFDAGRDDRYPVDGGVFDVPAGRDVVVIPIKPAVRVSRPAAFAVTVERPDGAVVSNREQVVAIAHTDR
jgi:Anti-sigma-K factor rskA